MNKKLANLFVQITAKHPLPFIGCIVLGVGFILSLTLSTNVSVISTYDGSVKSGNIIIEHRVSDLRDKIYVYTNRNEAVYSIEITEDNVKYGSNLTIIQLEGNIDSVTTDKVKVDITIGKTTLFERVFLKGGKINHG